MGCGLTNCEFFLIFCLFYCSCRSENNLKGSMNNFFSFPLIGYRKWGLDRLMCVILLLMVCFCLGEVRGGLEIRSKEVER